MEPAKSYVNKSCPKCGYIRKSSDTLTSQEECPRCGVLYAKAIAARNKQHLDKNQKKKREETDPILASKKVPHYMRRLLIFALAGIIFLGMGNYLNAVDKNHKKKELKNVQDEMVSVVATGLVSGAGLRKFERDVNIEKHKIESSVSLPSIMLFSLAFFLGSLAVMSFVQIKTGPLFSRQDTISRITRWSFYFVWGGLVIVSFSRGYGLRNSTGMPSLNAYVDPQNKIESAKSGKTENQPDAGAPLNIGPVNFYLKLLYKDVVHYLQDHPNTTLKDKDIDTILKSYAAVDELFYLRRNGRLRAKGFTPFDFEIAILNGDLWTIMNQGREIWTAKEY